MFAKLVTILALIAAVAAYPYAYPRYGVSNGFGMGLGSASKYPFIHYFANGV